MSSSPIAPATVGTSTRPYLIRALHEWCTDNGFTPYVAVFVDAQVQVPVEYVKNNEIVLNVGFEATSALKLGNETIEFRARFGGSSREIIVPIDHVIAIYARENGQGMAFPMPTDEASSASSPQAAGLSPATLAGAPVAGPRGAGMRPALTEVGRPAPAPAGRHAPAAASAPTSVGGDKPFAAGPPETPEPPPGGRPSLKRIK